MVTSHNSHYVNYYVIKGESMKKQYVDYLALIGFYGLSREFNFYCRKHRNISVRRNARNFLLKSGKYNDLKVFRKIGFDGVNDLVKIAKEPVGYGL